jgi:phytochrome-interacting factor 3
MESTLNELLAVPAVEVRANQDDDMVPWLNYPLDEPLQHDYCSDFLPELSGVTVNEHSSQSNFPSFDKRSCNQSITDSHTVSVHNGLNLEQGDVVMNSSAGDIEANRPRTSASQLYPSSSEQCKTSFPFFRSRDSTKKDDSTSNAVHHVIAPDSIRAPTSGGGFPSIKMQKQVPAPSPINSSLMNFSHFARPAALVKANLQNVGMRASSGTSSMERMQNKDKGSIGLPKETDSRCRPNMMSSKVEVKPTEVKPAEGSVPAELPEEMSQEGDSKSDRNCHQNFGESAIKGLEDVEKTTEPLVASSSVGSGNSAERPSDDPTENLKRKHRDTEESEGPSEVSFIHRFHIFSMFFALPRLYLFLPRTKEIIYVQDAEEESVGAKKPASARAGNGSKRGRAAEVHNLSERVGKNIPTFLQKICACLLLMFSLVAMNYCILIGFHLELNKQRRRDRINEKMRALQELIPNCNKVGYSYLCFSVNFLHDLMKMSFSIKFKDSNIHQGFGVKPTPNLGLIEIKLILSSLFMFIEVPKL